MNIYLLRLHPSTRRDALDVLAEAESRAQAADEPGLTRANSLRRAIAVQYTERHPEALRVFEEVFEAMRGDDDSRLDDFALQHAGKCLAETGRLGRARSCLERALELRSNGENSELVDSTQRVLERVDRL